MDKQYNPKLIEQTWYQKWEHNDYFSPKGHNESFCLMLPPPNITGSLHMGHGFQQTLMDTLVRYHRMQGKRTLWQMGTDHAGISAQLVVEKQLAAEGQDRQTLGRAAFVQKIWDWKETSGDHITQQIRRLGSSVDWTRERFTLDNDLSATVCKVFVDLYEEGLIYRGKRLVNWDPILKTAISDLEVIQEQQEGSLWYVRYPMVDSENFLSIATTRPETLFGDVAIAVHPDDPRYQHLIGQHASLPLVERHIPIIADSHVDPEFGTGCVKVTPAHDFNDYQIGQRHQLSILNIFTPDACLNEEVPKAYQGMDRFVARKKVIDDLKKINLLEKIEPHTLTIPRGEKSNAIIEPYLTDQWFVKVAPLVKPAVDAVARGDIKFVPDHWTKTYFQWMENIQDWCISRQLWWGHRIPAWYDEEHNAYVGYSEKDIRFKYKLSDNITLQQDEDVLDTWFSSALWPFATLGWPKNTEDFQQFYPTDVLVTGFDIIFFWVARMIMMSLKFTGQIPFHTVYMTGLIRDAEGQKMSKTKGNVLDPIDLVDGISLPDLIKKRTQNLLLDQNKDKIERMTKKEFPKGIPAFGADALRFTYCALANTGRDIRFDLPRIEGYYHFCNKLWNASRYVLMHASNDDFGDGPIEYGTADHWIRSKLQHTIREVHSHFKQYRFDLLANTLYDFVWHEYCDWYLELSKVVLYDKTTSAASKRGARQTLSTVLEILLRLLHPLLPFITEEIWQANAATLSPQFSESLMLQNYPEIDSPAFNGEAEHSIDWLKQIVTRLRSMRSDMNVPPHQTLSVHINHASDLDKKRLTTHHDNIMSLGKLQALTFNQKDTIDEGAITILIGELELSILLDIDAKAELKRLDKQLEQARQKLNYLEGKLNNTQFTAKAPDAVIEKTRNEQTEWLARIEQLEHHYQRVKQLDASPNSG